MTARAYEALRAIEMIADGLRLLDAHFGALTEVQQERINLSALKELDAIGVDRLLNNLKGARNGDH